MNLRPRGLMLIAEHVPNGNDQESAPMSQRQISPPPSDCLPSVDELKQRLHDQLDTIIAACSAIRRRPASWSSRGLSGSPCDCWAACSSSSSCAGHDRLDLSTWIKIRGYRLADPAAQRTLKTSCGSVIYGRAFLIPRRGGGPGVHPLDVALGLTRDAYSPLVIGWFCRLATRVSFRLASDLGAMFLGSAPPVSAIEEWVLGLARPAAVYLGAGPLPEDDGEVLVIEVNGKAAPTATEQELARRRGRRSRHRRGCDCGCQRHRGQARRRQRGRKPRRKKGDKSKNGRSATLVVMYTLRRGEDGRLHGPCNKKVYGTFGSRHGDELGAGPGDATGLPGEDGQGRANRHRWREVPGAAAPSIVPRSDSDLGHPARAGEALGGGTAVSPGREPGVG